MKQIVGSTLSDDASSAPVENFVASRSAAEFAELYRRDGLAGGHVIMLGPGNEEAALSALRAYPGGLQVGGGVFGVRAERERGVQPGATDLSDRVALHRARGDGGEVLRGHAGGVQQHEGAGHQERAFS